MSADEIALRKRFTEAIRSLSKPAILVGPNWLSPDPSKKPGTFVFAGIPKIAKALKQNPVRVHSMLLARLKLEQFGLTSEVSDQMVMRIYPCPSDSH